MRFNRFISFLIFIVFYSINSYSIGVNRTLGYKVASNFLNDSVNLVYKNTEPNNNINFYIFNSVNKIGFVVVSGDTNTIPILGYSNESRFDLPIPNNIGIYDWLNSTAFRVNYIVTNQIKATPETKLQWNYYKSYHTGNLRSGTIGPLLTTRWNQNPYYNSLCPPDSLSSSNANKSVTGCVATAMAQIMKYWNYPSRGIGSNTYNDSHYLGYSQNYGILTADFTRYLNWTNMPNTVNTNSSPVDSLMYELGVAVEMDYSPSGSGAYVLTSESGGGPCSQTVYVNNFFYDPSTISGKHLSHYTDSAWMLLMQNEINSGRVVQYEGDDATQGGHTWVMDGYNSSSMLHMNWGWGGVYNGYFSITNLNTGSGSNAFNPVQSDAALIGIQPLSSHFSLDITSTSTSICKGDSTLLISNGPLSGTYQWTPNRGLSCYSCKNPIAFPDSTTTYTLSCDSSGNIELDSISINVYSISNGSFTDSTNGLFVYVSPNNLNLTSYSWNFGDDSTSSLRNPTHEYLSPGTYYVTLVENYYVCSDTSISTVIITPLSIDNSNKDLGIKVLSNPSNNFLFVDINSSYNFNSNIQLYNLIGQKESDGNFNIKEGNNLIKIDISSLSKGVYFICIGNQTIKFSKI